MVMARWFDHMRSLFERHGGRVQKFVGDAVVAVFGIPVVNEDDALRAVRAAAELGGGLGRLNAELERDWGVTLQVRTGVNTGEVVTGDPAIGDALVLGDAVNVAARLEQVAAPGEVLLGQSTYRLVRDAVDAERVTPLHLKGKGAPVVAYRLGQVDPGAPGHARRQDAPIVGREPELRLFAWVYERVVEHRQQPPADRARPGRGGQDPAGHRGRGRPAGGDRAARPLPVLRRGHHLLAGGRDRPPGRRHRRHRRRRPRPRQAAPAAGHRRRPRAASPPGRPADRARRRPRPRPRRRPGRSGGCWSCWPRRGPLVVVLDDLHWAEPGLLDLVEHVADYGRGAPILLVAMARPEFLEDRPGWAGGKLNATTLLLEPLGDAEATQLLTALAGPCPSPRRPPGGSPGAAEGNPLFLEELLAALVEEGRLRRQDGHWVAADLDDLGIPPSIQALLTARLDRLEEAERAVLERAAVAGQVFDQSAVVELSPPSVRTQAVPARLQALVRRELLRPARARLAGDQGFQFRHLLLRDATYDSIPKQARAELHELFAVWGERTRRGRGCARSRRSSATTWSRPGATGSSWASSTSATSAWPRPRPPPGRGRPPGPWPRRPAGRVQAAGAGRRPAPRRATRAAWSCWSSWPTCSSPPASSPAPRPSSTRSAAAAAGRGDERLAAHARVGRLRMEVGVASDLDAAALQRETRRAIATFAEFEDQRGLAKAWGLLAALGFLRCRIAEAEAAAGQAVTHARLARDDPSESWARGLLAQSAFWGPVPAAEGIRRCQELLEQAAGNRRSELTALQSMAGLQAMAGQAEAAQATVGRALALAGDMGENRVAALAREFAAIALSLAGDPAAAAHQLRQGIRVLERQGESGMRSNLIADLAHVLHQLGRPDEALHIALASRAIAADDDLFAQVRWRGAAARSLALQGRLDDAERLAAEAVGIASEPPTC